MSYLRAIVGQHLCTTCLHRLHSTGFSGHAGLLVRALSVHEPTRPKYNYGLSGKGKTKVKERVWRTQQTNPKETVNIHGEVLFGIHPILLALSSGHRQHFYNLYLEDKQRQGKSQDTFSRIRALAEERNVDIHYVPKKTLTYLSGDRPHQGACLDTSSLVLPDFDPQTLLDEKHLDRCKNALWLLLYNVQDPMNFGAILRSSFFLGVDQVIVPVSNSCSPSPVVSKASSGALEVIDLCQVSGTYRSILQLTKAWQSAGGVVVGTASDTDSSRPTRKLQDFIPSSPTLLIVGNEGSGVDSDVLDLCDVLLTIAPYSEQAWELGVESLNVSVATGILIHWLQSSRRKL